MYVLQEYTIIFFIMFLKQKLLGSENETMYNDTMNDSKTPSLKKC